MENPAQTSYQPPFPLLTGHLQTIYPAFFRNPESPAMTMHRLDTPDDDFLDYSLLKGGNKKLAIISHGLEGSSTRSYILGMVGALKESVDIATWNFRSCGDEMNRQKIMYHSGATYDLASIVDHLAQDYEEIIVIGFSLGGNLTLKYLGESPNPKVMGGVAISTPLDLMAGSINLSRGWNRMYEMRFLRSLRKKLIQKNQQHPGLIDLDRLANVRSLIEFDDIFTGPIHGFKGAEDYYTRNSSKSFLEHIKVPTEIINPLNDPMLTRESLQKRFIPKKDNLHFHTPAQGGHCGFPSYGNGSNWVELETLRFIHGLI